MALKTIAKRRTSPKLLERKKIQGCSYVHIRTIRGSPAAILARMFEEQKAFQGWVKKDRKGNVVSVEIWMEAL